MIPRGQSFGIAAATMALLGGCSLLVSTSGLTGGAADGGGAESGDAGSVVDARASGGDGGTGTGPDAGFCAGRPAGTVCADFTAGDSPSVFTPRTTGAGALSDPTGSPRAVTASVPATQDKDEAYLTATTPSATWIEGDLVFEVSEVPNDGTSAEAMLLYVDFVGDYYEAELVLSSRPDQDAVLGQYSDSTKSGPARSLSQRLIPGVHRATMRLELDGPGSGKASIGIDGATPALFPVAPPQGKVHELGVQAGIAYVDSPHEAWKVRVHALAVSSGTL